MVSRIELDEADRRAVERARRMLAESEPSAAPEDAAAYEAWCADRVGRLLAAVDMLLQVVDQGGSFGRRGD
ncbi:hypothetical protein GCM10009535_12250 [Streptomyces thermocarboxydovorans]|uniref:Uncharacterized protein n=1 Tax=Streptomyces thermocarboxydovorans TaxID=59298 RepID=A0ABP3SK88_9ACTN